MATKLSGKSCSQYMDPNPKFLGIKVSHGSLITAGSIILTQMGNKYYAGDNVTQGRNFTLNSNIDGRVYFTRKKDYRVKRLSRRIKNIKHKDIIYVSVKPPIIVN